MVVADEKIILLLFYYSYLILFVFPTDVKFYDILDDYLKKQGSSGEKRTSWSPSRKIHFQFYKRNNQVLFVVKTMLLVRYHSRLEPDIKNN